MKYAACILFVLMSCGCLRLTTAQEDGLKHGAGAAGTLFGLPPIVTEAVVTLILGITHVVAHKNGRRCERKKQTKQPKAVT